MTTSAKTKLGADELDALAQTLRPSWELLFGNGAPQDFIPPPTPPTRRVAQAQPETVAPVEPRVRRQDSVSARAPSSGAPSSRRTAAQKSFPEPAVSVPTSETPWGKIAILAAVALVAGGIAIMVARSGNDDPPTTNEAPTETKAPAAEEKPVSEPPPEEKAQEPTPPPVEEKASEPPAPPPVAAPPPETPQPPAPKAPAPKAPAPKAPAPKAPSKPQPKGDGIVREVPF